MPTAQDIRQRRQTLLRFQPYRTPRALWIGVFSAIVLSAVMILGAVSRTGNELEPHFNTLFVCIANLTIFILLFIYNFWILRMAMRDMVKFLLCLIGSLLMGVVFTVVSYNVESLIYGTGNTSNPFYLNLITNLAAGLISFLVSLLIDNLTQHQRTILENEHLMSENLSIRYNTLQKQVSPHFLFNSLNTLDGLIGNDDAGAHQYLHQLAATFRYSMQDHKQVTLADELQFTQSYIYMMQIRHGANLHIEQRISPSLLNTTLPPISLQLLVENAIKHNVISQRHPLTITIETTDRHTLRVSNPRQPKADSETSAGIGLSNLNQRYHLLFDKEITITDQNDTFSVEIPLI